MNLELGILPIKYFIIEKRLKFLRYILNENKSSMIRKVFDELKKDSRRGDFIDLVVKDMEDVGIDLSEDEIGCASKLEWKKYVKEKVNSAALECLTNSNSTKTKTKHIQFHELKLSDYLSQNKNTSLSKTIFEARSGILDIKTWNSWKYSDLLCVMCEKYEENMDHFMTCRAYGKEPLETNWTEVFGNIVVNQNIVAKEIKRRQFMRKRKLDEVGLPPPLAPLLQ